MAILRDIFKVAQEEERLRMLWPGGAFQPFTVSLAPARSGYEGMTVPEGDEVGAIYRDRQIKHARTASAPRPRISDPLSRATTPKLSTSQIVAAGTHHNPTTSLFSQSIRDRHIRSAGHHRHSGSFPGTLTGSRPETGLLTPRTSALTAIEQFPTSEFTYSLPSGGGSTSTIQPLPHPYPPPLSQPQPILDPTLQFPFLTQDFSPHPHPSTTVPTITTNTKTTISSRPPPCEPEIKWPYPTPIQADMLTFDPTYLGHSEMNPVSLVHDPSQANFTTTPQFWNLPHSTTLSSTHLYHTSQIIPPDESHTEPRM